MSRLFAAGFELDAIHMAVVLCCAKVGIFASNILFSWELSADVKRSHYFPITFLGFLICAFISFIFTVYIALPRKGWKRRPKKPFGGQPAKSVEYIE